MENNAPQFLYRSLETECYFCHSSAWKFPELEASFAFVNFDYPVTHRHMNYCEICVVYSGEIMNYVNGHGYLMRAGDCCLLHRDDQHMMQFTSGERTDYVAVNYVIRYGYYERLKYAFGNRFAHIFECSDQPKAFHLDEVDRDRLYRETLRLQNGNNEYFAENELACKEIIIQLLKKYVEQRFNYPKKEAVPDWLQNLLIEMQKPENIHKRTGDFMAAVGYSNAYIAKEFKRHVGHTMVQYLTIVKLKYAEELLIHTGMTILEISAKLGFNSLSHFTRIFKENFGYSPSAVRKSKNQNSL